ncbi:MAG: alginate export family protein [Sphingorhabdus sp.]
MKKTVIVLAALCSTTPAFAQGIVLKPLIDARLRYEGVEQVGTSDADAVTARVRAGVEATSGVFSFLVEGEGTLAISEDYNSGLNGKALYPIVADPENVELNRLQVQFKGIPKTVITVGRQRINLDDQRFVGSVGWRQNEQTFDAARIEWTGVKNVKADVTYALSARTIWGIDGFGARQQSVDGDNVFANLSYKHKIGTLTGFAYLVDQDEAAVSAFQMSSQTYGVRFAGAAPLSKVTKLTYAASYARQSDYHNNPNDYSADYFLGELGVEAKGFKFVGGYEVLGADSGVALTSFQTPLATLHKFNGWADKFLTTPANGLRDAYATFGYTKPKVGPFDSVAFTGAFHNYKSDRLGVHYGNEMNAQFVAKMKKYTFILKVADYQAKAFATDTQKFWASVEWAF